MYIKTFKSIIANCFSFTGIAFNVEAFPPIRVLIIKCTTPKKNPTQKFKTSPVFKPTFTMLLLVATRLAAMLRRAAWIRTIIHCKILCSTWVNMSDWTQQDSNEKRYSKKVFSLENELKILRLISIQYINNNKAHIFAIVSSV